MIKVFILEINQYDQMLIVVNRGDEKETKIQIKTNQFSRAHNYFTTTDLHCYTSRPCIGHSNITPWFGR